MTTTTTTVSPPFRDGDELVLVVHQLRTVEDLRSNRPSGLLHRGARFRYLMPHPAVDLQLLGYGLGLHGDGVGIAFVPFAPGEAIAAVRLDELAAACTHEVATALRFLRGRGWTSEAATSSNPYAITADVVASLAADQLVEVGQWRPRARRFYRITDLGRLVAAELDKAAAQ